eukprot:jgi/Bigna1/82199/fgenesh1_pg.89_\
MEDISLGSPINSGGERLGLKRGLVRGVKCPRCGRRYESTSVMLTHLKESHFISKRNSRPTKQEKHNSANNKEDKKIISKNAKQTPLSTPKRCRLVVDFDALLSDEEQEYMHAWRAESAPSTPGSKFSAHTANSNGKRKIESPVGTRRGGDPKSPKIPYIIDLDALFENNGGGGQSTASAVETLINPACNRVNDCAATTSKQGNHVGKALSSQTGDAERQKVTSAALRDNASMSAASIRVSSKNKATTSLAKDSKAQQKVLRSKLKTSNKMKGKPSPFPVRSPGLKSRNTGSSLMPLHDSIEDTLSRNDRGWKFFPCLSLRTTFFVASILLLLYAGTSTLILVVTIGQHRAQVDEGYDFQILVYYTYLFGQEACLFVLYLRTIKPSLVRRENIRTWGGIIATMCFLRVMIEWRLVRAGSPSAVVGIFAILYGLANMTAILFYPLHLLLNANRLGDAGGGGRVARCWEVLSVTKYPAMVLFYLPLMVLTFCLPLAFPFDQAIFTLLLAVWSVFGVVALIGMVAMKECLRHDHIGYVLYCALTSYSPRVIGNVISALTRLNFAYKGVMLVVATKVIFQVGMFMTSVQLNVLITHGARQTNSLLFAWQFGQYFIVNALFLDGGLDGEFVVMFIVNMASSILRDSGILHEFFCKYIMKMTESTDIANEMREIYTLTQQNSLAEVLCAPLLLVMVMVEYAATGGETPLGIPIIMSNVDRAKITDVLLIFVIMVSTNILIGWTGNHLFTKRMSRLEKKSIVTRLSSPRLLKNSSLASLQIDDVPELDEGGGAAADAIGDTPKSHPDVSERATSTVVSGGAADGRSSPPDLEEKRSSFAPQGLGSLKDVTFAMYDNTDEREQDGKETAKAGDARPRPEHKQGESIVSQPSVGEPSTPARDVRFSQESSSRPSTSDAKPRPSDRSDSTSSSAAMSLSRVLGGGDGRTRLRESNSRSRYMKGRKMTRHRQHTRMSIFAKKRVKGKIYDLWRDNGLLFFIVMCVIINSTRHWTLMG